MSEYPDFVLAHIVDVMFCSWSHKSALQFDLQLSPTVPFFHLLPLVLCCFFLFRPHHLNSLLLLCPHLFCCLLFSSISSLFFSSSGSTSLCPPPVLPLSRLPTSYPSTDCWLASEPRADLQESKMSGRGRSFQCHNTQRTLCGYAKINLTSIHHLTLSAEGFGDYFPV